MRKFLILLMCSLSLLGIDTAVASSDKPAKKVILTNVPNGEFNPMGEQQYVLYIGEEAGTYEITCTTLSGCVYSGMLTI